MEKGSIARELVRRFREREGKQGSPSIRVKEEDFWWLNTSDNGGGSGTERSIALHCPEKADVTEQRVELERRSLSSREKAGVHDALSFGSVASALRDNFSLDPQLDECRERIMSDCERILRELGCENDTLPSHSFAAVDLHDKVPLSPMSMSGDFHWMLHSRDTQRSQEREGVYSEGDGDMDCRAPGGCREESQPQCEATCGDETAETQSHTREENSTRSTVLFISPASSIRSADFSHQEDLFAGDASADPSRVRPPSVPGSRGALQESVGPARSSQSEEDLHSHTDTHQAGELSNVMRATDWAHAPLNPELVKPFLSDQVVSDLWTRLQTVKKEIDVRRIQRS